MSIQNELERTNAILDSIEDKIGGGGSSTESGLIVRATLVGSSNTLDKTWKEIKDAVFQGTYVILVDESGTFMTATPLASISRGNGSYHVEFGAGEGATPFVTDSENGYPVESFN